MPLAERVVPGLCDNALTAAPTTQAYRSLSDSEIVVNAASLLDRFAATRAAVTALPVQATSRGFVAVMSPSVEEIRKLANTAMGSVQLTPPVPSPYVHTLKESSADDVAVDLFIFAEANSRPLRTKLHATPSMTAWDLAAFVCERLAARQPNPSYPVPAGPHEILVTGSTANPCMIRMVIGHCEPLLASLAAAKVRVRAVHTLYVVYDR